MAIILNIDTSSKFCSIALAKEGEVIFGYESSNEMDHSKTLAPFVKKAMDFLEDHNLKLAAVSVITGPGSYTGLRIGLSLAKGLAYSLDIPLITLSSLQVIAVSAIFSDPEFRGEELIVPMMDAGRMEVYTAVFDSALNLIKEEAPLILDENSFSDLQLSELIFVGDGSLKFKDLFKGEKAKWAGPLLPHAKYMTSLSEKYFRQKRFSDIAYTTPKYLKEYITTKSKSPFQNIKK